MWKLLPLLLGIGLAYVVVFYDPHPDQPAIGEVWCMRPDGDPFTKTVRAEVVKIQAGWIKYTIGPFDRASPLHTFLVNYERCKE